MSNENAPNPSSPLLDAAIQLHEMYLTLIQAGFTENQALTIVSQVFRPGSGV